MKYQLLQDLPFAKKGSIFKKGCWVDGGWGINLGTTHYKGGGRSDSGVKTFTPSENNIIDCILDKKDWIKEVPQRIGEAFILYDEKHYSQEELIAFIKANPATLIKQG